ncbi:MAG: ATP-binding protein [Patescibacteria group bacterium]
MNSSILYFPISGLINTVTTLVFCIYILITNFKNKTAKIVFLFCLSGTVWSLGYFLWQISKNSEDALFWSKILMFGAIFSPIFFTHLVFSFLGYIKNKFYKFFLWFFYILTFFWVFVDFTSSNYITGVVSISYFKFWPTAGYLFSLFLVQFYFLFTCSIILLIKNWKKATGNKKTQIILLLIGVLAVFFGGSTNFPLWYGIEIPPWGNPLVSVFVALTAYSVIKYKFFNTKVIAVELFTSLFVIVFLVDVFLSNNFIELIFRIIGLLVVVVFGYMMIQSVHKEIQRREELLQLTHSLERANLRLQELDRQKTEFLSIASHQLRTPLSIAKGYLELLTEGAYGKVTPETKEILKQMDKSNDHLVKLADEFLNVTRIEQGKTKFSFADKDIVELIDRVVNELKIQAKAKKLSIIWRPTKEKKMVNMDDEKIRHVIFNFIDNAIKYSNKGKIQVSWTSEKNGVAVRVKDNGFGFCKEDEVNFFQKFYRGKNVEGINVTGVGLGLFICNKFIEAHEGHVWAHSQGLGKGSEFGFWIPNKRQIKKKAE